MENDQKNNIDPKEVTMQLRYLQNIYTQQYEVLSDELDNYTLTYNAIQKNIDLLSNITRVENSNILLNVDGGLYLEANTKGIKSVITYIGAGYLIQMNVDEAKILLSKNEKKGSEILKKLNSDKQKLENELIDINYKLNLLQQQ